MVDRYRQQITQAMTNPLGAQLQHYYQYLSILRASFFSLGLFCLGEYYYASTDFSISKDLALVYYMIMLCLYM